MVPWLRLGGALGSGCCFWSVVSTLELASSERSVRFGAGRAGAAAGRCRVLLSECCVRFGAGVLVLLQGAAVKAAVVGRARLLVLLQGASAGYCQRVVCILGLWVEIALCCSKKRRALDCRQNILCYLSSMLA